ncbi:Elongation factor Ts, mitochondrial [Portunus trituberculatus]|uniref:Elongation factor Ts, mitochondrial n=1 Tax=Portunus trituberculatus TaxID=210409 RepID=A0A5B7JEE8_PORTR|nr:Elongation factor Ts, mitochondrial [Portunus trituberculatus]
MNPKAIGEEGDPKAENPDDETLMLHQEFLSDPSLTVGEVLREEGLQVVDFVRYEAGETQVREE